MSALEASLLLGGVHACVLALVLVRRERNRRANRYLAALLGVVGLLLVDGFLAASGFRVAHPHVIGTLAWLPYLVGPLLYLYVREMTEPEPARLPPIWPHFVAAGVFVVLLATVFVPQSGEAKIRVAEGHAPLFIDVSEVALLLLGSGYVVASLVRLHRHREHVQERFSNTRDVSLRWLMAVVALNGVVWASALVAFTLRMATGGGEGIPIVPIGATVVVFVVGYFQLGQTEIFVEREPAAPPPSEPEPAPAYGKARLPDDDAAALEAKIRAAMRDDKLYQRAGLTLADLADAVAATPHEVSQILSTRIGRNFYTFVNEQRVEHVKAALLASDRPVLDLAFEAGFQSKSTFNAAFRKVTGMTPREFRDHQRVSTASVP